MSGQFMVSLRNALTIGLVIAFPYVLFEFWKFVKPALHKNERRYASGMVITGSLLFFTGVVFGYYLIVPFTVYFLGTFQVSASVPNQINLSSYVETITGMSFACGIVFEFPLVIYFLAKIGLATHELLGNYRKVAVVVILVLAAVITPSPDWVSQSLVAIPLYGLFEIGIVISKRVTLNKRRREQKEEEEYRRTMQGK
jgi:sec-independent protein translocase protein TatC